MELRKRFYIALAIFAAIGVAIWFTVDDVLIPVAAVHVTMRQLALGILGLFVLRTVLYWRAQQIRAEREQQKDQGFELM
jgi:hypothetical protein